MRQKQHVFQYYPNHYLKNMICKTYFFSSPMRAFEETSQQGGGGALEVAGGQHID